MEVTGYQKSYREYKAELDMEVSRAAEGFVRIGYLLKVARDTRVLYESPYDNVVDFAQAEYGIDKTQVSRFININDRFSEDGYSDRLQDGYRGYGVAKLALMLQLPDAVNEVLSPTYSKAEIRMVKEEVDAERGTTDIEVMLEGQDAKEVRVGQLLERAVWRLGEDEPGLYREIHRVAVGGWQQDALQEAMAPAGERTYSIRIAGVGRVLLSLKEEEGSVALVNVRSGEKQTYQWGDVAAAWGQAVNALLSVEQSWQGAYGRRMPELSTGNTVTGQGTKTPVPKQKKQAKVVRVGEAKKKPGKAVAETEQQEIAPVQPGELEREKIINRDKCLQHLERILGDLYRAAVKGEWEQVDSIREEIDKELLGIRALGL